MLQLSIQTNPTYSHFANYNCQQRYHHRTDATLPFLDRARAYTFTVSSITTSFTGGFESEFDEPACSVSIISASFNVSGFPATVKLCDGIDFCALNTVAEVDGVGSTCGRHSAAVASRWSGGVSDDDEETGDDDSFVSC